MSLQRETSGRIEQSDNGTLNDFGSSGASLRKRIMAVFIMIGIGLLLTMYAYHRSTYLGSTDWRLFSIYELVIGGYVVFTIVQILRKGRRNSSLRPGP